MISFLPNGAKVSDVDQNSEEWDNLRKTRPTSSEASKIYTGGGTFSTQREAYMRRLSIASKYPVPKFTGNKWTERGHELEPEAAERFAEKTGLDVRAVGFIEHPDNCFGCSPDRFIYHNDVPIADVEIKCFNMDKHLGIVKKNVLPTDLKPQVHSRLYVTGLPVCILVLYCPEAFPTDLWMIEVTPDDYTVRIGEEINKFCTEYKEKWAKYLAEYELSLDQSDLAESLPHLSALLNPPKEESIF